MNEDVVCTICIAADQVADRRLKSDITAVGGDGGDDGPTNSRCAIRCDGDERRLPGLLVMNEDVRPAIGVDTDQVAGRRAKSDITAVGRDDGIVVGCIISLCAIRGDGDTRGLPGLSVMNEDVRPAIGVAADQVAGRRVKSDITAIGRDVGMKGTIIPLCAIGGDGDTCGLPSLPVMNEDVP